MFQISAHLKSIWLVFKHDQKPSSYCFVMTKVFRLIRTTVRHVITFLLWLFGLNQLYHYVVSWKYLKYANFHVMKNPSTYFIVPARFQKIISGHISQFNVPSACFRKFAKCAQLFAMSPNYGFYSFAWQRTSVPIFITSADQ